MIISNTSSTALMVAATNETMRVGLSSQRAMRKIPTVNDRNVRVANVI